MRRSGTIVSTVLVLILAVCTLLPTAARAQTSDEQLPELSQDWTVRVGLYVLQSKTARSQVGEVGFSGLVERRVYAGRGFDVNIGIGYNGIDTVYNVPVVANIIGYQSNFRYGAGFGYDFGKRLSGRGTSGTVFDLILGYQLTRGRNPLSVDLRYYFIGGADSELDGYSLSLGMKF